jgi:hypothetical protein
MAHVLPQVPLRERSGGKEGRETLEGKAALLFMPGSSAGALASH